MVPLADGSGSVNLRLLDYSDPGGLRLIRLRHYYSPEKK